MGFVLLDERSQLPHVLGAHMRTTETHVVDVRVAHVTVGHCDQLLGQLDLGVLHVVDRHTQLYRVGTSWTGRDAVSVGAGALPSPSSTRLTRTAATFSTGCFDTGSQSVSVSSLAARVCPFPAPSPRSSQYP